MNTRVDYLDTAKGIAIILVAVGHCLASSSNPVNRLILSFHMPLFFIVSGILMTNKNISVSFGRYVLLQAKKLLIPQLTLGCLEIIFCKFYEFYNAHSISGLTLGGGYKQ